MKKSLLIATAILLIAVTGVSAATINLWHAYRGKEAKAIRRVARKFNLTHRHQVRLLMVPFGAFSSKLLNTIPLRQGPDVFIYAQDHVGNWVNNRIILPLEYHVRRVGGRRFLRRFFPNTLKAFRYKYARSLWALPGSFKNLCLFYNKRLVRRPPRTMGQLMAMGKRFTNPRDGAFGRWGLIYDMGDFYFHTMWVQGFGGRIFRQVGRNYIPQLNSSAMAKSMRYALKIKRSGIVPKGASGTLMTQLFNRGKAMFVISGQWFRGEIARNINYGVAQLPVIKESGRRAVPFLTVEGYFMARYCKDQKAAFEVIRFFTSKGMAKYFGYIGKQTPANRDAYRRYRRLRTEPVSRVFRYAANFAVPMPNNPEMTLTWGPATSALNACLGGANIQATLNKFQRMLVANIRKSKRGR